MKNYLKVVSLLLLALTPVFSFSAIKINEIAWMGDKESSYAEWIELFNSGDSDVDLSGAQLFEAGGETLIITLSKIIGAGSYFLIERVTPSVPDPVSGVDDEAGSFGGGGLGNSGEYLILRNSDGIVLDSIDASAGWPAGDSSLKQTMQLSGTAWITATATPKSANASQEEASQPSNSEATTTTQTDSSESSSSVVGGATASYSYSAHSSSVELSKQLTKIKVYLNAGRDRVVSTETPIQFSAVMVDDSNRALDGDDYIWSFGDGSYLSGKQASHIYNIPGDYVVLITSHFAGQEYVSRANIKAMDPSLNIKTELCNSLDCTIYIANNSSYEINLKGWSLDTHRRPFRFAADVIVSPGKVIPVSSRISSLEIKPNDKIDLIMPSGKVYLSTEITKKEEKIEQIGTINSVYVEDVGHPPVINTKTVDKVVDNYVEKEGVDLWKTQLASLKEQLEALKKSLSAQNKQEASNGNSDTEKMSSLSIIENKSVEQLTPSSSTEKIIIETVKRESAFWRFLKGVFGR